MKILITAGPTREALDPVRYLSNHSSGKMGYALAAAAVEARHQVLLISGPCALDLPKGVDLLPVESAAEMYQAVENYLIRHDVAIFAAAVADYSPAEVSPQKIKKSAEELTLRLVKTKDILGSARDLMGFTGKLIGFAAETENLEINARKKLQRKKADLIIANDVSRPDIGFASEENEVLLVYPDRSVPIPQADKHHLAHQLIEIIEDL